MENWVKRMSKWLPQNNTSPPEHIEESGAGATNPSISHHHSPSNPHPSHPPSILESSSNSGIIARVLQFTKKHDFYNPRKRSPNPPQPMDPESFRHWGKAMVDFVADYWLTIRERKPLHNVEPGYIWDRVAQEAPTEPESWEKIFGDLEHVVMQGSTHWHHPHFFAYFPAANSYPAIMGDILSDGLGCIGFTWNSSPACTELEMVVMDWLGKMIGLPEYFLNSHPGPGAGMIQSTASDSTLVALLAARNRRLFSMRDRFRCSFSDSHDAAAIATLVAYCSDQAHSSVERAALLAGARMRKLQSNDQSELTGAVLEAAMKEDIEQGLVPFFVCVTLGTTSSCAFDRLPELGPVCQRKGVWLHIDAAYAGSSFVCPEYRHLMEGIEFADSFNFNPAKWLMVNMDCSAMWFRKAYEIEQAFLVDPLYLKHEHQGIVPDYKDLQVPLGRRFRSLKLWFVLRSMGVTGLQHHIRSMCTLAKEFEALVSEDGRFEVVAPVKLGLVCFRARGSNSINESLLKEINKDRRIHLVPAQLRERYILRLAICSSLTESADIVYAWNVIRELYDRVVISDVQENGFVHVG